MDNEIMDLIDFYRILEFGTEDCREKWIEPVCYYYYTDQKEEPGRRVWYHRIMPLEIFLEMNKKERDEWLADIVKYIDDLTEEECEEGFERDLEEFKTVLPYEKLTMETPVGLYRTEGKK